MVHVKYPSMERQDLTQAQLGSFKFTPVDEAVYHAPQPSPHPLLLQQYNESLQNAGFDRQLMSPDIAADPSFFNHQIRPSLDTSRLRLGPAAVRAAVESASSSPPKRFTRSSQSSMRPNVSSSFSTSSLLTVPLTTSRHKPSVHRHSAFLRVTRCLPCT